MADLPAHDQWLAGTEAARLGRLSYTKRREEARLGRWTAKHAVAHAMRLDASEPELLRKLVIRNAGDGAPEVFLGEGRAPLSISMTDRADWAVCAVIGGEHPIGCDLELVEPRSERFVADYFTAAECAMVDAAATDHDLLANLIWSAKESTLKVLRTGLRRDTRSVDVHVDRNERDDGWHGLYATTTEGLTFTGWWRRFGSFVLTYVSTYATMPPESLVDPSPLLHAEPGHSWLDGPLRRP
jgi:4'-phosphopantetheinyl transferase